MIRSATSAKATTSVRRITGGSSLLLSGSGVPYRRWQAGVRMGEGFADADLALPRLGGRRLARNDAHNGFPARSGDDRRRASRAGLASQPGAEAKVPSRKREGSRLVDSGAAAGRAEPAGPAAFVGAEHQRCASIGADHDTDIRSQAFVARDRRAGPRRRCLAVAGAGLERASAQVLGYASSAPMRFRRPMMVDAGR